MDPADDRLKPLLGGDAEHELQRVDRNSVQYVEEVAEADFYVQQGLNDDARGIYNRILALDPDNEEIKAKLAGISPAPEPAPAQEIPEQHERQEPEPAPAETASSSLDAELDEAFKELDFPDEAEEAFEPAGAKEAAIPEAAAELEMEPETTADEPGSDEFFDLGAELREEFDKVNPGEAFGDARIEEVFQEFKKGVEQQLGKEDYETHYNLGIAYKEMGMLDDAINEFSLAGKDPFRGFDCHSMLGLCYLEKGDYESAVEHMKKGLDSPGREKGEYMALKYDLAAACERLGDIRSAQAVMSELYREDAGFRDVKARLEALDKALEGAGLRPLSETGEKEGPKPVPHKKSRVSYL
jgi:tetratricopeptide (TPR) repeat protein